MDTTAITFDDLTEPIDPDDLPPYDRPDAQIGDEPWVQQWVEEGVAILRNAIPPAAVEAYSNKFEDDAVTRANVAGVADGSYEPGTLTRELGRGYGIGTPYLTVPEMRDVAMAKPVTAVLTDLFHERLALHLNLSGWTSTLRDWHVDRYLNPPCVGDWYAAVWIALGHVDAENGPFEYVPGSHRWDRITRQKMLDALGEDGTDPDWPRHSERLLTPIYSDRLAETGLQVEQFHAEAGDVLIWHANLMHRGSTPKTPEAERRALISHWSVVSHRCDMPNTVHHTSEHADGWFFELGQWQ